jgi:hypothetical protein
LQDRGGSQAAGGFDHEFHSAREKAHSFQQIGVADREDIVHQLADDGKGVDSGC